MSANFEQATRDKFRFASPIGNLTIEDLWELPLSSTSSAKANLDDIARELYKQVKAEEEISFVKTPAKASVAANAKLDIVKRVIEVKMAENAERDAARAKKAKRDEIMDALAQAEGAALRSKTPDELRKMLEEL